MNPIRIIIAEDDPQIAEIQQRFLERIEGIELVGVAHTLQEAMELIDILQPQLILLDIQFPEGSGLDLLVKIRSDQQACDVILVTAAREVATLTTALRNGVFDYILKPLNFSRLESAINKYRDHINKLSILGAIAQSHVDDFINPRRSISTNHNITERLPKGIDPLTLDSIKNLFSNAEALYTAEQIGQLIGSGRTTARRYLEYLASQKILVPNISYGSVGRPERRYSLSLIQGSTHKD
ncbi:MAG: two-component system CitB family response regulator [Pseudohongiellaceae bacterium]|jgi:two-component system CitB family response regulator